MMRADRCAPLFRPATRHISSSSQEQYRESIETREPHAAAPKKERRATYKVELTVRLLFYMASQPVVEAEEEGIHITDTFN
jgi:hypothetical protein